VTDDRFSLREIYWAYHWYDEDERNIKTIGYFSDEAKAKAAIDAVRSQPGFRDYPNGFEIDTCMLDRVGWSEGFVSI
jgi:homoserine kinase type II